MGLLRVCQCGHNLLRLASFGVMAFLVVACGSFDIPPPVTVPEPAAEGDGISLPLFLAGDGGDVQLSGDQVLVGLEDEVAKAVKALGANNVVTLWLGDNIYPSGLPVSGGTGNTREERILGAQIRASQDAQTVFVLGNHDWKSDNAENQIVFFERRNKSEPRVELLPARECPSLVLRDLGEEVRLIFLDTEWWLRGSRRGSGHCDAYTDARLKQLTTELGEAIDGAGGRLTFVVGHHPLRTMGPHGYRRLCFITQDLDSRAYKRLHDWADEALQGHEVFAWVAGHDHSVQLIEGDPSVRFHLVSGAASESKSTKIRRKPGLLMGAPRPGYQRLDVYRSGAVKATVAFIETVSEQGEPKWRREAMWLRSSDP